MIINEATTKIALRYYPELGDRIKVTGGPFYMNRDQEFVPMGYRGRFIVQKLDSNGIVAYSEKGGYCHIYMGPDMQCAETKIWKTKHKLLKLKSKEKTDA